MKTLLLKFSGPLQSWGTQSNFETRHTDFYPSKSAIIGIISASLGYRRNETAEKISKLNELDFAIRIDQPGHLCKDFHVARKYKEDGRVDRSYVTHRYYMEDSVFIVAISHSDDNFISMICEGLRRPYFQPFMGRRALPLPADFIIGETDQGAVESLKRLEWKASDWYKQRKKNEHIFLEIYADSWLLDSNYISLRKDVPISFSFVERKFAFRYEAITTVEIYNDMEE